jgi:hypothetical protein
MPPHIAPERLHGKWLRVPEEDASDTLVYRPSSQPLPPARWRDGIELRADGTALALKPGRADVAKQRAGSWKLEGDRLHLSWADGGSPQELVLLEATPTVLRFER